MKKIIILFFTFSINVIFGQTELIIHLISDEEVDSISVVSLNISKNFSALVENSISHIEIPAVGSDQYTFKINGYRTNCWLNDGIIEVYLELSNKALSISIIKNSPIYCIQKEYFAKYLKFRNKSEISSEFIKDAIIKNDQDVFILVPLNHYLTENQ